MISMCVLMNHRMTESQIEDAVNALKVEKFIFPPENLQKIWEQIPADNEDILDIVEPVLQWLLDNSNEGDYIFVQGDFGATLLVVSWAFKHDRIPVYSTTQRKYESTINEKGEVVNVHTFKHVRFRRYRMIQ
ncbi:MAG TPA: CRISPR-associated protein Csx20 [Spirochaetota bacterium]|nr:CRISPR-associated protein Csx20 [Spirochaetota bacterium]HPP51157.1 CRISPR-associated protein Csx20 [Spirochaetota bacterium]